MKRIVYSVLAASAAAAVISGCSASEIVNTGGDTKCKDFLTQDEKKQNDEVSKMLKDSSGQDPTNLEITATKASVLSIARRSARKTQRSQRRRTAERTGRGRAVPT